MSFKKTKRLPFTDSTIGGSMMACEPVEFRLATVVSTHGAGTAPVQGSDAESRTILMRPSPVPMKILWVMESSTGLVRILPLLVNET